MKLDSSENKSENQSTAQREEHIFEIVDLIKNDHKEIKELIEVMKSEESSDIEIAEAFSEFKYFLTAHAKPEEEVLYNFMKSNGDEEIQLLAHEGDVEHTLADQLVEEAGNEEDKLKFRANVKVLAELVEHHIEEEEEEILPKLSKKVDLDTRRELANEYLMLRADFLTDSEVAQSSQTITH